MSHDRPGMPDLPEPEDYVGRVGWYSDTTVTAHAEAAYDAGRKAGREQATCGETVFGGHVCDRRPGHRAAHRCDHHGWSVMSLREAMEMPEPPPGPCAQHLPGADS